MSWSTGVTKEPLRRFRPSHRSPSGAPFRARIPGAVVGADHGRGGLEEEILRAVKRDNSEGKAFVDSWGDRMRETCALLRLVRHPGSRGAYLKVSEREEIYRLAAAQGGTGDVHRGEARRGLPSFGSAFTPSCGSRRWRRRSGSAARRSMSPSRSCSTAAQSGGRG